MDAVTLLRQQLQTAHEFMEGTMADVTPEQAHWPPPGVANPLGATYLHAVAAEDGIIHGMLQHTAPLLATSWAGRTGASEPMPVPGPDWEQYGPWARRVRVDLAATRAYAQAVYAASDAYLASLTAEALDQPLDLSGVGMGTTDRGWVLSNLVVGHVHDLMGEISCLKGLQGARGYPF
ncbi:MAG TPA: DinB family protein [Chloroflexia bacterium]|nr:DinB family protein [Chloroflexia bacterium]